MWGGRKINLMVKFPIEGLDLSRQVLNANNNKIVYDLYAVSNHFGGLEGGHYTAYVKNPIIGGWFNFDDSIVSSMDASEVNTKAAYVLFYKRR